MPLEFLLRSCSMGLLFLAGGVAAQHWRGLGPEGGDLNLMLADPSVPGRVYAVGAYALARSDDAGRSWTSAGNGLFSNGVITPWGFTADNQVPGRLYFLDSGGRLLRSDDAGANWMPTGYVLPLFPMALDYFPAKHTLTAVAGVAGGLLLILPNGNIYKSTDAGANFHPFGPPLPAGRAVQSVAFDPADPQRLLAAVGIGLDGGQSGAPLLRSSDGGASWSAVDGVPAAGSGRSIAFHGAQRVTAWINGQLYISTDSGQHWQLRAGIADGSSVVAAPVQPQRLILAGGQTCFSSSTDFVDLQPCNVGVPAGGDGLGDVVAVGDGAQGYRLVGTARAQGALAYSPEENRWQPANRGLFATPVRGLALQPGDSRRLYAGSPAISQNPETDQLFASSDGGQHWNGRLSGLARYIRSVEIDPTTAAKPGTTVIYAAGATLRMAGQPYNSGIYKSGDGGVAWVALDDGFPPYAGSNGGVDVDPVRRLLLDPRSCAAPPAHGACRQGPLNTVYAVTDGSRTGHRIYKSMQGGGAWQPASAGLPERIDDAQGGETVHPSDLEIDPLNGDLFLGVFTSYYSNDERPRVPRILSGVFRSSDGGASWQHRSAGLPPEAGSASTTQHVFAVAVHPRRAGVLWASAVPEGGASRIYRSTDSGASWTPAGATLPGCDVRELQIDSAAPDVIYAAGLGVAGGSGCVFRSEDSGAHWTPLHAGLPLSAVYDLRQDPADRRRLLLATHRGVWEALLPSDKLFTDTAQ